MFYKKKIILCMLSFFIGIGVVCAGELITNGGFETPDTATYVAYSSGDSFGDWYVSGNIAQNTCGYVLEDGQWDCNVHSGSQLFQLEDYTPWNGTDQESVIAQKLDTVADTDYNLVFWALAGRDGPEHSLRVSFGDWYVDINGISTGAWTEYSYTVTASSGSDVLSFKRTGTPYDSSLSEGSSIFLDDVSVVGAVDANVPDLQILSSGTDGNTSLLFELQNGHVCINNLTGGSSDKEFIGPFLGQSGLWSIEFRDSNGTPGSSFVIDEANIPVTPTITPDGNNTLLTFTWNDLDVGNESNALDVVVTVEAVSGTPETHWKISIDNNAAADGHGIWKVTFPCIEGLYVGTSGTASLPLGRGQNMNNPALTSWFGGIRYTQDYPSGMCNMQFVTLSEDETCLYLAAHDPCAYVKKFDYGPQLNGRPALLYSIIHYPENMGVPETNYVQPYPCVVGALDGDWIDAAKYYRTWVHDNSIWMKNKLPLSQRTDISDYAKQLPHWTMFNGITEENMSGIEKLLEDVNVPSASHLYHWHQVTFDYQFPDFWPPYPLVDDCVEDLHTADSDAMPYINTRVVDDKAASYLASPSSYNDNAVRDPNGDLVDDGSGYSDANAWVMCPATTFWQEKFDGLTMKMLDGNSIVYSTDPAFESPDTATYVGYQDGNTFDGWTVSEKDGGYGCNLGYILENGYWSCYTRPGTSGQQLFVLEDYTPWDGTMLDSKISRTVSTTPDANYTLEFWAKAGRAGPTHTVLVQVGDVNVNQTITTDWALYTFQVTAQSANDVLSFTRTGSAYNGAAGEGSAIHLDDIAFYSGLDADYIYCDQVGAMEPALCFNSQHGHPVGGGHHWVDGYNAQIANIRSAAETAKDTVVLATESAGEPYDFDLYLRCNECMPTSTSLWQLVYSGYRLSYGTYFYDANDAFIPKLASQYLDGLQIGWFTGHPNSLDPNIWVFERQAAQARYEGYNYLALGELLRDPNLVGDFNSITGNWELFGSDYSVDWPAVKGRVWKAPDGTVGLALVNLHTSSQTATFNIDRSDIGFDSNDVNMSAFYPDDLFTPNRTLTGDPLSSTVTLPARSSSGGGVYMIKLEQSGRKTYNFTGVTQATDDHYAYECDVDQFPFGGSQGNRNDKTEASDTDYAAIDANDAGEWQTDDPRSGDEMLLWVEMKIDEDVNSITRIDFTFNGNTDSSTTEHRMYVLKADEAWENDASWTYLSPGESIPADVDTEFTRSLTTSISDYIDDNGYITWAVFTYDNSSNDMRINYLEMVVHY